MVFSSLLFIFLYLTVVTAVYYVLPKKARNAFLFAANFVFYGYGEPVFIILMLFSIVWNYVCGLLIGKWDEKEKNRKAVLICSVIVNLGLLGFFKYAGFAGGMLRKIPGLSALSVPEVALPIGISFYTFQTMSYTIDVYRRDCLPQKNFVAFGTYVALFPQLIAGPIVRYRDVAEQLDNRRENVAQFESGVKLFLVGLSKKVLLANPLGQMWDTISVSAEAGLVGSWMGILAYSMQIYFDFSGYSDMAIGLGRMFGFEFLKNFDYPYISASITEFWRRWHISLGTWFREYVYIPLGGNRKGKPRLILNLLIVWMLTGLWHGAAWNFVLWGLYFGILLIAEKFFLLRLLQKLPKAVGHIYTMFLVVLGWVLFCFESPTEIFAFLARLFTLSNGLVNAETGMLLLSNLVLFVIAVFACLPLAKNLYRRIRNKTVRLIADGGLSAASLLICTASLVNQSYNPFLYFRF